jgi:tRNA threonylcarbamoyladenosine biosynthesis protein TsaE
MIIKEFVSYSENDTAIIAEEFAKQIYKGDVIVLNGALGTGKTFFVKTVANFFDVSNPSSPTFALVNEYYGKIKIYHFDFYRIKSVNELHDIGFEDYISDSEAIVFIEWGELFPDILPKSRFEIHFTFLNTDSRKIIINKYE